MKKKVKITLVGILMLEFFLQIISFSRYVYFQIQTNSQNKKLIENNWFFGDKKNETIITDTGKLHADYHPLLGWLPRPFQDLDTNVNNERIRETTNNPPENQAKFPAIYFFGGSTTWGMNVNDNETIPSLVAKHVNNPLPSYTITNFGQIAFNMNQELVYLLLLLKINKQPQMVIFNDGCNDLFYKLNEKNSMSTVFNEKKLSDKLGNLWQYFQPEGPTNLSVINKDLISTIITNAPTYLKIYYYPSKLISKIFSPNLQTPPSGPENYNIVDNESFVENIVTNYVNNARVIEALSQVYGFQYALLWQPLIFTKARPTADELSSYTFSKYHPEILYPIITNRLHQENINNFYDLTTAFDEETDSLFYDMCHVSPKGNEIMAQKIVEILKKDYKL